MNGARRSQRASREPPAGLGLDLAKANTARKRRADAARASSASIPRCCARSGRRPSDRIFAALGAPDAKVAPGFNLVDNLATWQKLSPLHAHPLDWACDRRADPSRIR